MALNNKLKYIGKYNKESYKTYLFRVRKEDKDIIDTLEKVESKNGYIAKLIREDIKSNNSDVLTIKQIKEAILPVLAKHNIFEVYLFGSYSRGEATKKSDVDIYCERGNINGLAGHMNLCEELKSALNKEIDLIFTSAKLGEFFEKQLRKDLIKLC